MKTFASYIAEQAVHYFDWDDTLSHPSDTRVHVNDASGKRVKSLTTQEYNTHKLEPGHKYDYSDFKSSEKLKVKPIRPMMAKMKAIHKSGGKVEILTARSDFDDKEKLGKKLGAYGIDINKIHFRRAGNLNMPAAPAKAKMVSDAIKKYGHKEVHLYDDAKDNIDAVLGLKKQHPDVAFHGHHVQHEDGKLKVTHYRA